MKPTLLIATCLLLQSCTTFTHYTPGCMTVDVSEKKAVVAGKVIPVKTAYKGTGGRPKSNKTPIGTLKVIAKEPHHRFGPVVRLGGVSQDGYKQDGRGILIHRAYGSGTRGCIGIPPEQMLAVYAALQVGDVVKISL
jgi:hypothetical protein